MWGVIDNNHADDPREAPREDAPTLRPTILTLK